MVEFSPDDVALSSSQRRTRRSRSSRRRAFVGAALYGVGNGLMWPSYLSMLSETGAASMRGRLQGVANSAGSVASIVGMLGGGAAFASLGREIFWVAAAALAVSAVLFVLHRRDRKLA